MSSPRVLVAGVGNVFFTDDGFGVEVARRLAAGNELPAGTEVADIGIRGMHLAYQLLDGYRALVLVDTTHRDGPPGTLYVLEHDLDGPGDPSAALDAHGMSPDAVLALLDELAQGVGAARPVERVVVVGCEPGDLSEGMGLSPAVSGAVDEAVRTVVAVVNELVPEGDNHAGQTGLRGTAGGRGSGGRAVVAGVGSVPGDSGDVTGGRR